MSNGGIIGPVNDPIAFTVNSTTQSFTASGTFTTQAFQTAAIVMLVAGGGGGGGRYGGGGGAGGMVLTPACGIPVSPSTSYPIVIGGGGPGTPGPSFAGVQGVDSTGFGLTAKGGGGGGHATGGNSPYMPGGSGGGSGQGTACAGTGIQPAQPGNSGTFGFGNPSGTGNSGAPAYGHAGGGGAGGVGGDGTPTAVGNGGSGTNVTPTFGTAPQPFYGPTSGVYAGGGAGGSITGLPGTGGPGGGGNTGSPGGAATVNTGGGGGGSTGNVCTAGGAGGSGIAIVKTNPVSGVVASGVWSLQCQYNFKKQGTWT